MSGTLPQPIAITGIGGASPVGATAIQTCTSIRAGLSGFAEHAFFETLSEDPEWEPGEPLTAACFPSVDPFSEGRARLLALCIPALIELGQIAKLKRADLASSALLLSLPVPDAAVAGWGLGKIFVPELTKLTGLTDFQLIETIQSGHTGVFEMTKRAHELLTAGECEYCFLVGVDSYLSVDRMTLWDQGYRLRSPRSVDGFIPGEASSALLLELPSHAEARGATVMANVTALGFEQEADPITGERASSGGGLCTALREVIPAGESARWIACDLNGESYRSAEWGLAVVRLADALAGLQILDHPADCIGDVGAATGGILMSHAAHRLGRSRPPASDAVLFTAADDGRRAAMKISAARAGS